MTRVSVFCIPRAHPRQQHHQHHNDSDIPPRVSSVEALDIGPVSTVGLSPRGLLSQLLKNGGATCSQEAGDEGRENTIGPSPQLPPHRNNNKKKTKRHLSRRFRWCRRTSTDERDLLLRATARRHRCCTRLASSSESTASRSGQPRFPPCARRRGEGERTGYTTGKYRRRRRRRGGGGNHASVVAARPHGGAAAFLFFPLFFFFFLFCLREQHHPGRTHSQCRCSFGLHGRPRRPRRTLRRGG